MKSDQVLALPTSSLSILSRFQGYSLDTTRLSMALDSGHCRFIDRDAAETDPSYKQIIPYVLLRYSGRVFSYVRGKKSSEARLIAKRSIGIGGHIEPADLNLFSSDLVMYIEAARREVHEEVHLGTPYTEHIVALINDDSTDVGKVHLGIMHIWDLAEPKVTKREGLITQAGFVTIASLKEKADELETWSQIALQVLEDPRTPPYAPPPGKPVLAAQHAPEGEDGLAPLEAGATG